MSQMPDPVTYVDEFQKLVDEWRTWHHKWEEDSQRGQGVTRSGNFMMRNDPVAELLNDADKLLSVQAQVNTMMLAAIDELKKRLDES